MITLGRLEIRMKYELLESKYTMNYTNSYLLAIKNNEEAQCFVGNLDQYRMNGRDSDFTRLSDPAVLLEYCIYPLYASGDFEITKRVKDILKQLILSDDVIKIYQAINFIYTQDKYLKRYDNLPVVIDVSDLILPSLNALEKHKDEMQTYKEDEFALYPKSMYDIICSMIKKSRSFN